MRSVRVLIGSGVAAALLATGYVSVSSVTGGGVMQAAAAPAACTPVPEPGDPAPPVVGDSGRDGSVKERNVRMIIAEGKALSVPPRGVQIAIATALVESQARNLASRAVPASLKFPNDGVAAGDHDSVGIMQQRVSMGWFPTLKEGMDPAYQTRTFYKRLLAINGWESLPFTMAAQSVQRSAFPSAYGKRQEEAVALYQQFAGDVTAADPGGRPEAADAVVNPCPVAEEEPPPPGGGGDSGGARVSGAWAHPLAPAKYTRTSPFGWRVLRGAPNFHKGEDLGAVTGTPVRAVCTGTAIQVGWVSGGGGNQTTLDCGGNITVKLMHQSSITVKRGAKVTAGDVIGHVGSTGNSTGAHLHVQTEKGGDGIVSGEVFPPAPWFQARGVPL